MTIVDGGRHSPLEPNGDSYVCDDSVRLQLEQLEQLKLRQGRIWRHVQMAEQNWGIKMLVGAKSVTGSLFR